MKKILLSIIGVLIITCTFSQGQFKIAFQDIISIDTSKNEIDFLHFKIYSYPEYYNDNLLTDIYYYVSYKEFGTPEKYIWVKLFDGHLINDLNNEYNKQWKGPFPGNRDISYKFLFEIVKKSNNINKFRVTIFSTNPVLDAKYCNVSYSAPFDITAYYYNTNDIKTALDIYSNVSTISTLYSIAKDANIGVAVASTVIEIVVIYAIKSYLDQLPIYLEIKCNVCGHSEQIKIKSLNYKKSYTCKTYGCHNKAEIYVIQ